jgi:hypothetical protein
VGALNEGKGMMIARMYFPSFGACTRDRAPREKNTVERQ